MVGLPRMLN